MPNRCFSPIPGERLVAIRDFVDGLDKRSVKELHRYLREVGRGNFPHCVYSVAAWGLIVLPGPGETSDPYEQYCDWTPGLDAPALHWQYPYYLRESSYLSDDPRRRARLRRLLKLEPLDRGGRLWPNLRKYLSETELPGGKTQKDKFACWGVVNLTEEHSRSENTRRTETQWDTRPLEHILKVCRPSLIIAPPGSGCFLRTEDVLNKTGGNLIGSTDRYSGDKGKRSWDFTFWETPWGKVRVGKAYTHPSWWGARTPGILTQEAVRVSAGL